jgi:hypothetical protein
LPKKSAAKYQKWFKVFQEWSATQLGLSFGDGDPSGDLVGLFTTYG